VREAFYAADRSRSEVAHASRLRPSRLSGDRTRPRDRELFLSAATAGPELLAGEASLAWRRLAPEPRVPAGRARPVLLRLHLLVS
jgi:hypothetical protein